MKLYILVKADSRKFKDDQYKLTDDCKLIAAADDVRAINEPRVTLLIHASDIRDDSGLRDLVIKQSKRDGFEWELILFTHIGCELSGIEGIGETTYPWNEAARIALNLPPQAPSAESLIALYLLCKGYLSGLSRLDSPEKIRDWWKLARKADFKIEIDGLKEDDNSKHTVMGLIDQLKIALDTEPFNDSALPEIVNNLHLAFSKIEQKGRFL